MNKDNKMRKIKSFFSFLTVFLILSLVVLPASAYDFDDIPEGIYQIDAKLSCYVNAMGGVEFGAPLLVSCRLDVLSDGSKTITLFFTKRQVTIYGITCDTFIDVSPAYVTENNGVESGTLGYYDADGTLITDGVNYTLSDDTAENSRQEQVHYVDSLTFPIDYESDTYSLTLFVNSNVMGTQFTADGYAATLTVDWSSVSEEFTGPSANSSEEGSALGNGNGDDSSADGSFSDETTDNVESMDGLNIHHADSDSSTENDTGDSSLSNASSSYSSYLAFFKEPLLLSVATIATALIAFGVVLVLLGRRKKVNDKSKNQ